MSKPKYEMLNRWEEVPEIKYWLNGGHGGKKKAEKTITNYLSCMRCYMEFRQMNPPEMIEEVREARQRTDYHERTLPEAKVSEFHSWLMTEYTQKARGRQGKRKAKEKKGVSETLAHSIIGAIRGFYRSNGFSLDIKIDAPAPKEENFSYEMRAEHVKKMLHHARSLRDRAVTLTLFQSGLDVQTLCRLNYGHVAQDLESDKSPVMLSLVREKRKVKFRTFLGLDAVEAIKEYLQERKYHGENITWNSPLFLQEGKHKKRGERLKPRNVDDIFKDLVVQSGIISEDRLSNADINPARPYALRAAFSSIMGYKGVDRDTINYFMGHKMPYNSAYHRMTREELEELYKKGEEGLSISGLKSVSEIEEQLQKQNERIETYRSDMAEMQSENQELKQRLEQQNQEFEKLKQYVYNRQKDLVEIVYPLLERYGLYEKIEINDKTVHRVKKDRESEETRKNHIEALKELLEEEE